MDNHLLTAKQKPCQPFGTGYWYNPVMFNFIFILKRFLFANV